MTEELKCYICKSKDPPLLPFPFGSILFEWLVAVGIHITEYSLKMRLCSLHFEEKYLLDSRTQLTNDAIPTLFLGPGGTVKEFAKKTKFTPRNCSIPGCSISGKTGIRMYTFPTDERRNVWKIATGLKSSHRKTLQACLLHFNAKSVNNTRLNRSAVPMIGVHHTQSSLAKELKKPGAKVVSKHSQETTDEEMVSNEDDNHISRCRYFCSVPGCDSDNFSDFRMFGFPKDERRNIWLESVGLTSTKRARLLACVLHFDEKLVKNTRLSKDAVPILGVHPSQNRRLDFGGSVQEEEGDDDSNDSVEIDDQEVKTLVNKQCSVPGCNTNNLSNLRIFSFPKDEREQIWRESVGKSQSKRKILFACILHFDKKYVNNTRLDRSAIPILGVHPTQVHWLEPLQPDNSPNSLQEYDSQDDVDTEDVQVDVEEIDDDHDYVEAIKGDVVEIQDDVEEVNEDVLEILDDMDMQSIPDDVFEILDDSDIESIQDDSCTSEPQAIINNLGIKDGFLPGTRTVVRIIEKLSPNITPQS